MARKRILMDCDTGTDDALAILYALAHPDLELVGVCSVFGNASTDHTTRNTLQILELADRGDVPVARGASDPLKGTFGGVSHPIHGANGLGGLQLPPPVTRPVDEPAHDFIIRTVRRYPNEITLVPVGRMTNVALALKKDPEIAHLADCVLMGGAAVAEGNVTAVAEANIHGDPEAAQILFRSGMDITMVGLDVTMVSGVTEAEMDAVTARGGGVLEAVAAIFGFRNAAYLRRQPQIPACPIHDALAVDVVADPSVVRTELLSVDVECEGTFTRGMTVADRRPYGTGVKNVKVCLEVDAPRFKQRFLAALASYREEA